MRNLWIFINKYNAFFLFLIFEVIALIIYINYNSFQKATFISAQNQVTGSIYTQADKFSSYLRLSEVNDSLARENARLRNSMKSSFYVDTLAKRKVTDTIYKQQYTYLEARVITNSVNMRSNYLTIDKGSKDGIEKGMGVICGSGVVGKVINTSAHFSTVQSMLHKGTVVSAMLASSHEKGFVRWGDDLDPRKGVIYGVSNNAQPKVNDLIVTSDRSLWPQGIPVGKLVSLTSKGGGYSLTMDMAFSVNFSKLEYVDVVINNLAKEQAGLEAQEKKDE